MARYVHGEGIDGTGLAANSVYRNATVPLFMVKTATTSKPTWKPSMLSSLVL